LTVNMLTFFDNHLLLESNIGGQEKVRQLWETLSRHDRLDWSHALYTCHLNQLNSLWLFIRFSLFSINSYILFHKHNQFISPIIWDLKLKYFTAYKNRTKEFFY